MKLWVKGIGQNTFFSLKQRYDDCDHLRKQARDNYFTKHSIITVRERKGGA